jgi:signal transduction histidine kinase
MDVFSNLISNAIKHSDPGKPLDININAIIVEEKGREYNRVTVEDNGSGIPDTVKEKLFARLQRGKTRAEGSGLGLYLVKRLVESFKGRVWVEDRVKGDYTKGSRFVVMLPAVGK